MQFAVGYKRFSMNKNSILDNRNNSKFQSIIDRPKLNLSFSSINGSADFNFAILNPACYVRSVYSAIIEFCAVKDGITLWDVSLTGPRNPFIGGTTWDCIIWSLVDTHFRVQHLVLDSITLECNTWSRFEVHRLNHIRLQYFHMIEHMKNCSLIWFNPRASVTL